MTKGFQKSANNPELQLTHPGILHTETFNKRFELRCYEPSADLQPFVTHVWVQRQRQTDAGPAPLIEILSGPNMYLFFTAKAAFVHDITRHEFNYDASGVVAGVKFRPGGFYPFLQKPAPELSINTPSLVSLFPHADEPFRKRLVSQTDQEIVAALETLLRSKHPKPNKNLELIARIMTALETDPSLKTVESVARTFGMSNRSLQLLFQTHVGVGLKWIISRRRLLQTIGRAQEQSHPSWAKAAAELGYSSQSHFTREFKEIVGQSPSQSALFDRSTLGPV